MTGEMVSFEYFEGAGFYRPEQWILGGVGYSPWFVTVPGAYVANALRIANAQSSNTGYLMGKTAQLTTQGIEIRFKMAAWGSFVAGLPAPANGLSFFLRPDDDMFDLTDSTYW